MNLSRAFFVILLSLMLSGSVSTHAAYRPIQHVAQAYATHVHTSAAVAEAPRTNIIKTGSTRAERRLHRLMHRLRRAMPEEGEGKVDTMSLVAMILGVVGLVGIAFFPLLLLLSIPAFILGLIGLRKVKLDGTKGYGFAIAGIVSGALGILVMLVGLVAAIVILSWFLK